MLVPYLNTWSTFIFMTKKRLKWNYEACYKIAQGCEKIVDFKRKNQVAYNVARKEGWIKDYTWFMPTKEVRHLPRPNRRIWTFEKCYELAKECETLSEFEHKYHACACTSRKYGWTDSFTWLKRVNEIRKVNYDNVYVYLFKNNHAVYVGRTLHPNKRDATHRKSDKSTVYQFATRYGIDIPPMKILESGLTLREGARLEDFYRRKYESEGWDVLNKRSTGVKSSSVGSMRIKWTRESCYNEAKKYHTIKDFMNGNESAYKVASINKWTEDYTWLERAVRPNGYWTKERCLEEAKKYKNSHQFQHGSKAAYSKAYLMGWLKEFEWEGARPKPLTYDEAFNIAKKYNKLSDFRKEEPRVLDYAFRHKWLSSFDWLEKRDVSSKEVLQYDMNGILISTYKSIREASNVTGLRSSGISNCCRGVLKTSQGFIWRFADNV